MNIPEYQNTTQFMTELTGLAGAPLWLVATLVVLLVVQMLGAKRTRGASYVVEAIVGLLVMGFLALVLVGSTTPR